MSDIDLADFEVQEVRAEEQLDTSRVEPYLREHLPRAEGEMTVAQFGKGHANLTYLVRFGEDAYVLRRPPHGPVPAGAHDMRREHRVLSRLWEAFPLAPRSFFLCEDESLIGAIFHVMERREGVAIRSEFPPQITPTPELNRKIGEMATDVLADLHKVDPAAVGLDHMGRPDGYVDRQLEGWTMRWHDAKDQDEPDVDFLSRWLADNKPVSRHVSLLHNDYKLDNMLLDPADPTRPTALLDWDMCTRGDPLTDLGQFLCYWAQPDDDPKARGRIAMPTWMEGFPTRAEVAERYAARTGFDCSEWEWYHVFGIFKLVVVLQQIYIRYVRGQTSDPRFQELGPLVRYLAQKGRLHAVG